MNQLDTFRLLILTESQNTAEQLISLFRNASHAVRGHRVTSEQDLIDHIDDQEWDILLCDNTSTHLSFTDAIKHTKEQHIPCIRLVEDYQTEVINECFEIGATDVVDIANKTHLLHSTQREIESVRSFREGLHAKEQLEEATQRADQLLSDTQEAIAYVADGMHIQANESYADIFGYDDADELEALPIIDLIADNDQEKFKAFLRHYSKHTDEQAELNFSGLKQDDSHFSALMILSPSSFEGEACTQILIRTSAQGGTGSLTAGNQDLFTGLPNRYYLNEQIKTAYGQSQSGLGPACFMLLQLDDLEQLLYKYHVRGVDQIVKDCASVLQPLLQSNDILTHFDYGCLGIISFMPPEEALKSALNLCKAVESHICELESQTLLFTSSIGITLISEANPEVIIDEAYQAINQLKALEEKSGASVYLPEPEQGTKPSSNNATVEDAIENERISLSYQPIISLRGDSREHYEVFVALNDMADGELTNPYDTLTDIQDTKLDRWVILEATKALATHQADGHECRLIINLSAFSLADDTLVSWLAVALKAANLPIDSVIWQFSESSISRNLKQAKETIESITALGGLISISKFGRSGSDPLKTLKHVKTNFVKVDGDYIMGLQENNGDPQVLKALISSINEQEAMSIVPEVENASILATLWQVGVNYIQGTYLQGPSDKMNYEFTEIT